LCYDCENDPGDRCRHPGKEHIVSDERDEQYEDGGSDLARYIAKRAKRNPAFPQMVEKSLRERQARRHADQADTAVAAGRKPAPKRNIAAIPTLALGQATESRRKDGEVSMQRKRGR
jgi:hypothetical protein